jgi:hypothetical protein
MTRISVRLAAMSAGDVPDMSVARHPSHSSPVVLIHSCRTQGPSEARISHRLSSPVLSGVEVRSGGEGRGCKACDRGHRRRIHCETVRRPTERNAADTALSVDAADSRREMQASPRAVAPSGRLQVSQTATW